LKIWGWKVTGNFPTREKKKLYVVMPHTSNWDFPVGIFLKFGYNMDVQYIAKHTLFEGPFGWFFRATGGVPVDRSKSTNFVDAVAETFSKYDKLSFAIAPEGTRKKVNKLRTGFYWIARKAQVPMVLVKWDWGKMNLHFSEGIYATEDFDADMAGILAFFKDAKGRIPENGYGYMQDENRL
jgi:1-acyl-sn-glycerol-3-phosphate acyltransferase